MNELIQGVIEELCDQIDTTATPTSVDSVHRKNGFVG